ncbi:hypothetical protein CEUSTIGMA_g12062.t1 [Chlamydomonas eustigma]|uniref:Uncharacterized protein n=1 Tax=Chlamydomonas eustigma TaxID=1157962 RepID=A0A250XNH6_9CHLO|nr:hypothetical protein CEUSTIGMA_g12062.t1 [Chlamydomonas eustigma]|eukprot:GAX84641.1 hypothetical protein CEUSTIGMA_g12062.t1 [Chlamydomonas eustigma]
MPKHDVHDSGTMMSDEGDHDAPTTHLTDLDQFLSQYIRVLTSYRLDLATVVQEVDQTGKDFDIRVAQLLSSAIGEAELSTHFDGHISSTAMQQQAAGSSSSGSQVKKKRVHTSAATGVGMPNSSNNYTSLLHSSAASLLLATADPRAAFSSAPYGTGCPDGYLLACKDAKEEEEDAGRAQGFEDVEMQCTLQEASEEDPREVLKKKYADKLQQLQLEFSRKRRKGKLPQAATDVLRSWWEGNKAWPYPTVHQSKEEALEGRIKAGRVALLEHEARSKSASS